VFIRGLRLVGGGRWRLGLGRGMAVEWLLSSFLFFSCERGEKSGGKGREGEKQGGRKSCLAC
jgi:hypothetical protein